MNKFFTIVVVIVSIFWQVVAWSQSFPLANNELYWKNRRPHKAYWQQDVHYTIDVKVNEEQHTVGGHLNLRYWNNSPDTLREVYFHLYQNAFVKNGYAQQLQSANKVKPKLGKYEQQGLGTTVSDISVDKQAAIYEIDNTILKITLITPLPPQQAIDIDMDFTSYWDIGSTRRRMKMYNAWGFMHYNGCQWYPKVAVYDTKFGWDTYQHLGKEFYGNFGVFDVTLDFPANYVVEATGVLQNRNEVLPPALREQLDLKNFKDKKWNEAPSIITPYVKTERKKWHFKADFVHDFAFTADPSYRIATTYWNGIECVGIAQEPHASGWQGTDQLVATIIKNFSNKYGTYHYPKMVAADAADGMEYPMITLDNGSNPGYRGLLVHEIGHNWYYGMLGSNETYRAGMDEGFTQYITAEGLRMLDGDTLLESKPKGWRARYYEPKHPSNVRVLTPYVYNTTIQGDHQLNTHSDDFNGSLHHGGGYSNVYYKSASMLYSLRLVLGDSLFHEAMLHYFHQWKFAHPYFEDFKNSIIQYTKTDLNWFFDQWWETTKPLDYGVAKIKKLKHTDSFAITFYRKPYSMQMPIDFVVKDKKGQLQAYYIPNGWYPKATNAITLPKWTGWGKIATEYTAIVHAPNGVKSVIIDTSNTMPDRYMLNNSKTKGALFSDLKFKTKLDIGEKQATDRNFYRLYIRPDVWYNALDGWKVGANIEGGYLQHIMQFNAQVWYNTTLGRWNPYLPEWDEKVYQKYAPVNYAVSVSSPFSLQMTQLKWSTESRFLDGFWKHKLGIHWQVDPSNTFSAALQTQYANNAFSTDYLLFPNEWSSFASNKNTQLKLAYTVAQQGQGYYNSIKFKIVTPIFQQHYNYNYLQAEHLYLQKIAKLQWKSRIFVRKGWGNILPRESSLFLAMAAPEDMIDNKFTRSQMVVPHEWQGFNNNNMQHFHTGGGLNLRGYNGYFAYDTRNGSDYLAYKSRSGVAVNGELDFSNYIRLQPQLFRNWLRLNTYLFADAGMVELMNWNNDFENIVPTSKWSDVRVDAGIGMALTVHKWGRFNKASPLTIRADFPLYLNRPMYGQQNYFDFRWMLGIGMSF